MHKIQQAILELASQKNIGAMTLRELGEHIGEKHPQKIKHHLNQLHAKGLLSENNKPRLLEGNKAIGSGRAQMISIPILGSANCGIAKIYAAENLEGYLTVSSGMIPKKKKLFAVRAVGISMNRSNINGKSIEDGDYAIIDAENSHPKNGDYVLSVIGGSANIKRFFKDSENNQIVLISESTQDFPPIYIHMKDFTEYMINGKVMSVIKKPKLNVAAA